LATKYFEISSATNLIKLVRQQITNYNKHFKISSATDRFVHQINFFAYFEIEKLNFRTKKILKHLKANRGPIGASEGMLRMPWFLK
jgi:hypothetical protein